MADSDVTIGTKEDDVLVLGDGDDLAVTGKGDDVVLAGSGENTVILGPGNDVLVYNYSDNDELTDSYFGGEGQESEIIVEEQIADALEAVGESSEVETAAALGTGEGDTFVIRFDSLEQYEGYLADNGFADSAALQVAVEDLLTRIDTSRWFNLNEIGINAEIKQFENISFVLESAVEPPKVVDERNVNTTIIGDDTVNTAGDACIDWTARQEISDNTLIVGGTAVIDWTEIKQSSVSFIRNNTLTLGDGDNVVNFTSPSAFTDIDLNTLTLGDGDNEVNFNIDGVCGRIDLNTLTLGDGGNSVTFTLASDSSMLGNTLSLGDGGNSVIFTLSGTSSMADNTLTLGAGADSVAITGRAIHGNTLSLGAGADVVTLDASFGTGFGPGNIIDLGVDLDQDILVLHDSVVNSNHTVENFHVDEDKINLADFSTNFASLALSTVNVTDTLINIDGVNTLTLDNVAMGTLDAGDFIFA